MRRAVYAFGFFAIGNSVALAVAAMIWFQVPEPRYWGEVPAGDLHPLPPLGAAAAAALQRRRQAQTAKAGGAT